MRKILKIKAIIEFLVAFVCLVYCGMTLYNYGINVPVRLGNPMLIMEVTGIVSLIFGVIDQAVYEDAERWEEE